MKKPFIVMIFILLVLPSFAAAETDGTAADESVTGTAVNEEEYIVYDVYKHMDTANNIHMGIGGLSIAAGVGMAASSDNNQLVLGAGLQNIVWGLAETGLAVYEKNWADREKDPEKARKLYNETAGRNLIIDLSCIAGGGILLAFGNDTVKGHGMGIMMQGALLAVFDSANYFISGNPEDIRDWNAGWNVQVGFYIVP